MLVLVWLEILLYFFERFDDLCFHFLKVIRNPNEIYLVFEYTRYIAAVDGPLCDTAIPLNVSSQKPYI